MCSLFLFLSVLCFSVLYLHMSKKFLWDLVLETVTGCIPTWDSVILMTFNFPSFLSIEIVCSFDLIATFVKTKHLWKTKLCLNFLFPCLGSILAILYAEICIYSSIFIVPLLTMVPHLKITDYSFVISITSCSFSTFWVNVFLFKMYCKRAALNLCFQLFQTYFFQIHTSVYFFQKQSCPLIFFASLSNSQKVLFSHNFH